MDPQRLIELFDETAALFHRLKMAVEQVHGQDEMTAGRRGVMRSLARHGPLTVPQLARQRPVSRQHIQAVVDGLLESGLVEAEANSAHKRSPLIVLTEAGRKLLERMAARERRLLAGIDWPVNERAVMAAARVLRQVRTQLENLPEG